MKRSHFFIPMKKEVKTDPSAKSAAYAERIGLAHMIGSGMYTHLPLGYKIFANLKAVLTRHLLAAGCAEHQFPAIQPLSVWKDSGRFEIFGSSIFVMKDQHGRDICLAPTHEVAAAYTAKCFIRSYRDLPVCISQIQTKFRDEARPRGGLIRTREFTMHDAYSFDTGIDSAAEGYEEIKRAYINTLIELRVPFTIRDQQDMGAIGGVKSHEFHVFADAGEDHCPDPDSVEHNSLEIAHIFMLGEQHSKPIGACYADRDGALRPIFMCSFGMGIERTAVAFIESYLRNGKDLLWSWALAPFKVMILGQSPYTTKLYRQLTESGYDTLLEDRDIPFSQQLREGFMLGLPVYCIFGRQFEANQQVEIRVPLLNKVMAVDVEDVLPTLALLEQEIKGIELVRMTFNVLKIDFAAKNVYILFDKLWQLEHSYCQVLDVPTDLLGNYGKCQPESKQLKAGPFWLIPLHVNSGVMEPRMGGYKGIPYIDVPSSDPMHLDAVAKTYNSHWRLGKYKLT